MATSTERLPAGPDAPSGTVSGLDPVALGAILLGLAALYVPTFHDWLVGTWANETEGRELLILGVSLGLFWWRRRAFAALQGAPAWRSGVALFVAGLAMYLVGRTFDLLRLELVSLMTVLAALLLCHRGTASLKLGWFPLFFLVFAFPLPYELVLAITGPMKEAVSAIVERLLYALGYPIARSGVVLTVGQYELLVVEACAGLQTMFTLEAMGLLYMHLMAYRSQLRNTLLAVLVVPISFAANVVRVLVLALVTYHLGDDAAQGMLHGFAGLLLFAVGLALIISADSALGRFHAFREPSK